MKKTIIAAAALVAMVGCNKGIIENPSVEADFGYINLGINTETEMVVTKGLATNDDLAGYNITLKKGGVTLWTKEYEEAVVDNSIWKVEAGNYSVYVENLTVEEAYNDEKGTVHVSGETPVTVTAGVATPCNVTCTPQNSMVTFIKTDDFDVVFDEPSVSVKESDTRTVDGMTIGKTHDKANAAYFEPVELTWTLTAKLNGETKIYTKSITAEKAKWAQVTFTTGSTDGQINVTITVDGQITDTQVVTATIDPIGDNVDQVVGE